MPVKECFVIMPIGAGEVKEIFRNRYEQIIRPAVEGFRFKNEQVFQCIRGDDVAETGSITRDIIKRLYRSDVVIADITSLNANVFYELGVRHALRSGTILIGEDGTVLPFDVSMQRVIRYVDTAGREKSAIEQIQAALAAMMERPNWQDSPVTETLPEIAKQPPGMELVDGVRWKRLENGRISTPIDGRWLEILDRFEGDTKVRHYSIFRFQYEPTSHLHPFLMMGESFRANGESHSHWETRYMRIEQEGRTIAVEYIYSAVIQGADSRRGYGVSRFWPHEGDRIVTGSGHYLAAEEKPTYKCNYRLERIDEPITNMTEFIQHLNEKYGSVPTGSNR
jgi:hypothetical protein